MWAQMIETRVKPDLKADDLAPRMLAVQESIRNAEQPGSGLLRTLTMRTRPTRTA
jgi:hypothetical protein